MSKTPPPNNHSFSRPPDATFEVVDDRRERIPEKYKIEFQRLRLRALEYLANLRAFEYSGRTIQAGITAAEPEGIEDHQVWATVHPGTMKSLLQVVIEYYRRIYENDEDDDIEATIKRFLTAKLPVIPDLLPADITYQYTHEVTSPRYLTRHLDICALEMRSADMLVTQVYLQPQFHSSLAVFRSNVPALSEAYRTPLFESSQRDFYTLVVNTFEAHPAREQIPWPLTAAVFEVAFPPT
jgi:hypothetical protein